MKYLRAKIQEVASKVAITVKNEKLCQATRISGTQGAFSDKVTPEVDGFTDEPVVQCDLATENTFVPAGIYLLKVNNRNTRRRCKICSKLTRKAYFC